MKLLGRVVRRYGWQVVAWCLMGNHYHLIVRTRRPNLGRGMRDLNGAYARRFNERHGRYGSVFAERYADKVIRSEEHFLKALRYVALNPVWARLVRRPEHWRWSSHAALAGLVRRPFALAARVALRLFRGRPADYRAFVDAEAGLSSPPPVPASGTSQTTARGGSASSPEKGCSFQGTSSASTPNPFPTSEPP
jgi:putative transposase